MVTMLGARIVAATSAIVEVTTGSEKPKPAAAVLIAAMMADAWASASAEPGSVIAAS
jgi:hypothetical protein